MGRGLRPPGNAEFFEQVAYMEFNGTLAESKNCADFPIGLAFADPVQYFMLSFGDVQTCVVRITQLGYPRYGIM